MMYSSSSTPVALVENHSLCRKNRAGEKVIPNGQAWRPELLLLCHSLKVFSDAVSLFKPQEPSNHRNFVRSLPLSPILSLPKLLSWLLPFRAHLKLPADQGVDSDIELDDDVSDSEQEEEEEDDEYNQLPPFKPLRKTQLAKLSKEHRKAYFDEYDYRVKLLHLLLFHYPIWSCQLHSTVMDDSAYRYRSLEPTLQFLTKSLLELQGWDHDCGYDSVIAEYSHTIAKRFPAAVFVNMTKDKKEFSINLDSSVCAKHGDNGSTMAGLLYVVSSLCTWSKEKPNCWFCFSSHSTNGPRPSILSTSDIGLPCLWPKSIRISSWRLLLKKDLLLPL
uniref:Translocase of chloroplast 159/132 membrane anchor domain-containing protein n=1 Tax=Noccaea caerulescens TaxID=107243 RepID=A0A1J3E8G6_NOCCA